MRLADHFDDWPPASGWAQSYKDVAPRVENPATLVLKGFELRNDKSPRLVIQATHPKGEELSNTVVPHDPSECESIARALRGHEGETLGDLAELEVGDG